MVKSITEIEDFKKELVDNKLVIIDYWANWCGPCKNIAPFYEELSKKYNACFLKVDIDEAEELSESVGIKCLPTFQIYKNGEKIEEINGADKEKLESAIKNNLV